MHRPARRAAVHRGARAHVQKGEDTTRRRHAPCLARARVTKALAVAFLWAMNFTTLSGDGNDIAIDAVLDGTIDALYIYADQACAPCACVRLARHATK